MRSETTTPSGEPRPAGPMAVSTTRTSSPTAQAFRSLAGARQRLARRDADIVRTQVELAQIAAPTGEEGERAEWVARRFTACGLRDVHVDAVGNVLGRVSAARDTEPVVVCAHLDTVFPRDVPLAVRRDGLRIVGPGINDNGRGLAVTLALAEELARGRVRTSRPVEFVATTGEEGTGDLRGAKHFLPCAAARSRRRSPSMVRATSESSIARSAPDGSGSRTAVPAATAGRHLERPTRSTRPHAAPRRSRA
jgi:hypothetical protein